MLGSQTYRKNQNRIPKTLQLFAIILFFNGIFVSPILQGLPVVTVNDSDWKINPIVTNSKGPPDTNNRFICTHRKTRLLERRLALE